MNYSEMSDFEINKLVAEYHGFDFASKTQVFVFDERASISPSGDPRVFNPCNSWDDAGPIIEENKLIVWPAGSKDKEGLWNACWSGLLTPRVKWQPNPLRAAMICYLMLKESESC